MIRIFTVLPAELTETSLILSVDFIIFHSKMLSGCSEAIIKKNDSFASNLAIYRAKKESAMKRKKAERERQRRKLIYDLIGIYREYMNRAEPLSDAWCDCYNAMQMMIYRADMMEERAGNEKLNRI